MAETTILNLLAELGKSTLSEAVKDSVKDWITDKVRVRRAIQKTAFAFSTKLPGTEQALTVWVQTDTFQSVIQALAAGILPERLSTGDDFISGTGIGFGASPQNVVREMLSAFYANIREDLVSARQGLVAVDNRTGEVLRQLTDLREDLAAQTRSGTAQAGIQRVSTEFLSEVAQKQGWGTGPGFGSEIHVNLELPPAVQNLATRASTVDAVRELLQNAVWYAMYGGSGSGKTQLAILISQSFAGMKVWIRLGGPTSAAGLILESALAKLAARPGGQPTQGWLEAACSVLGSGGVIVLDDLPSTTGDGALDEHLVALCGACATIGVRLVTTSSGPLSHGVRAAAGNQVREEAVPRFGEDDIRQLFLAYGAPRPFMASTWFSFVQRTAKMHPVLLVEAARYLHARGWATDDTTFEDLLRGTFASALDSPTVERIRQTVPREATREFLYRLKVIGWPFGVEEVQRVSAVPPSVPLPLEHLSSVIGLWIQRDSDREYVLSPLISRLTDDNLPKELQRAIHLALAHGILEKRRLGPLQASQVINHFVTGGDLESAASVLLMAWHSMLAVSELNDPFVLTATWAGMPLPSEIPLEKRIYLRAMQIILRRRLGRDAQYERADLERLQEEGESDENCQLVIAVVGAMMATYLGDKDPEIAIRSLQRGIKASRRVDLSTTLDPDLRAGLLTLLWMIAAWIRSDAQFLAWFATVRDLTADEVRSWEGIKFAAQASDSVCSGLWTRTADLPDGDEKWPRVLAELERLKTWAESAKVFSLASSALRSQIIVTAEYQMELPKAEMIAKQGLDEFRSLPQYVFLIADTIARQHYYFGDPADAVRWFKTAFEVQDAVDVAARVAALTIAGLAAYRLSVDLSRRYLEEGVEAAASKSVGALASVTVRGELGILLWNAGQHREAYAVWSSAAEELLAARRPSTKWKTLFRLFGNCTGYFVLNARGTDPQRPDMTVPFSGLLLREITDIDQLHNPEQDWLFPVQMAMLAESVGAYDGAVDWALRSSVGSGPFGTAARALLAGALTARDLDEQRCLEIVRSADIGNLDEGIDAGDFAQLGDDARAQRAAGFVARLNLLAVTIELARERLHDRTSATIMGRAVAALSHECVSHNKGSRLWPGFGMWG